MFFHPLVSRLSSSEINVIFLWLEENCEEIGNNVDGLCVFVFILALIMSPSFSRGDLDIDISIIY